MSDWSLPKAETCYSAETNALLDRLESDLKTQLASKPKRFNHSVSVAQTSEAMALLYGVDPLEARVAGLLHDWDKAVPSEELMGRAKAFGIDMGVDLHMVEPLLHGKVAALELPGIYPHLSSDVLRAIDVHTTGAADMSGLDMVLFVADGIEPLRKASPGIKHLRDLVGKASLEDLYWESFVGGIQYVLSGGRYLWPGTIDTYNQLAAKRAARSH